MLPSSWSRHPPSFVRSRAGRRRHVPSRAGNVRHPPRATRDRQRPPTTHVPLTRLRALGRPRVGRRRPLGFKHLSFASAVSLALPLLTLTFAPVLDDILSRLPSLNHEDAARQSASSCAADLVRNGDPMAEAQVSAEAIPPTRSIVFAESRQ
jgi:hypothetical protein